MYQRYTLSFIWTLSKANSLIQVQSDIEDFPILPLKIAFINNFYIYIMDHLPKLRETE